MCSQVNGKNFWHILDSAIFEKTNRQLLSTFYRDPCDLESPDLTELFQITLDQKAQTLFLENYSESWFCQMKVRKTQSFHT